MATYKSDGSGAVIGPFFMPAVPARLPLKGERDETQRDADDDTQRHAKTKIRVLSFIFNALHATTRNDTHGTHPTYNVYS